MNLASGNVLQSVFATYSDCQVYLFHFRVLIMRRHTSMIQGFVSSYQEVIPNTTSTPTVYMYPCGLVAGSRYELCIDLSVAILSISIESGSQVQ